MTQPQAPEIYQKPLSSIDTTGLPPRGTAEFEQALLGRIALDYASRGWSAAVVIDGDVLRVVAVPERGIAPKKYVLGLLQNGFLSDALPMLEALHGMLNDADIAYNYGICLSELGKTEDSVAPLLKCLELD
ncbi:MAG: hypothetical protein IT360_14840, partial [Gemmatimonadaceae bacterium]|nr:hypothetical protein [Gemmatimonadaceae bacterium]